jgi:hypothetical protein
MLSFLKGLFQIMNRLSTDWLLANVLKQPTLAEAENQFHQKMKKVKVQLIQGSSMPYAIDQYVLDFSGSSSKSIKDFLEKVSKCYPELAIGPTPWGSRFWVAFPEDEALKEDFAFFVVLQSL